MNMLAVIGVLMLVAAITIWIVTDLVSDASKAIAPDEYGRRRFKDEFEEGSAFAREAMEKRFDENAHWLDAKIGIGAMLGIVATLWIVFG